MPLKYHEVVILSVDLESFRDLPFQALDKVRNKVPEELSLGCRMNTFVIG